jgi:hypothetical protein
MFKRIHSNRDPQDTVFSELKKEYQAYFDRAGNCWRSFLTRYPKFLFGSMIFLMVISLALSFTVFRLRDAPVKAAVAARQKVPVPVTNDFSRIIQAGAALKETIVLKRLIDSVTAKPALTRSDSLALETALDRLQQLNKNLIRSQ